ncbi:hypothetical protein BJ741DRAFT_677346 [Chytriomyces cf. hyalinus JEL632]|nr:hypothetical protein BJ741DRAFT_677346 [Chytriomyces cf. hyalinus JEL632]
MALGACFSSIADGSQGVIQTNVLQMVKFFNFYELMISGQHFSESPVFADGDKHSIDGYSLGCLHCESILIPCFACQSLIAIQFRSVENVHATLSNSCCGGHMDPIQLDIQQPETCIRDKLESLRRIFCQQCGAFTITSATVRESIPMPRLWPLSARSMALIQLSLYGDEYIHFKLKQYNLVAEVLRGKRRILSRREGRAASENKRHKTDEPDEKKTIPCDPPKPNPSKSFQPIGTSASSLVPRAVIQNVRYKGKQTVRAYSGRQELCSESLKKGREIQPDLNVAVSDQDASSGLLAPQNNSALVEKTSSSSKQRQKQKPKRKKTSANTLSYANVADEALEPIAPNNQSCPDASVVLELAKEPKPIQSVISKVSNVVLQTDELSDIEGVQNIAKHSRRKRSRKRRRPHHESNDDKADALDSTFTKLSGRQHLTCDKAVAGPSDLMNENLAAESIGQAEQLKSLETVEKVDCMPNAFLDAEQTHETKKKRKIVEVETSSSESESKEDEPEDVKAAPLEPGDHNGPMQKKRKTKRDWRMIRMASRETKKTARANNSNRAIRETPASIRAQLQRFPIEKLELLLWDIRTHLTQIRDLEYHSNFWSRGAFFGGLWDSKADVVEEVHHEIEFLRCTESLEESVGKAILSLADAIVKDSTPHRFAVSHIFSSITKPQLHEGVTMSDTLSNFLSSQFSEFFETHAVKPFAEAIKAGAIVRSEMERLWNKLEQWSFSDSESSVNGDLTLSAFMRGREQLNMIKLFSFAANDGCDEESNGMQAFLKELDDNMLAEKEKIQLRLQLKGLMALYKVMMSGIM